MASISTSPSDPAASEYRSRARRDKTRRFVGNQIVPRIILILMCGVFILPFYWMVSIALKDVPELTKYPPTLYPHEPLWSNFKKSTEVIPFWNMAWNTTVITFFTILGALISNPIIAYGFSRIEWPGRDKLFMIVLATVFMPYPVIIVALVDIFAKLGWTNTILPLVAPIWLGSAFWIFLMRQFMMQIPKDLSDAARLDGANEFRIFWNIILPQCVPALGVIAIFAGIHAWNDFLGPLIFLLSVDNYTLAIGLTFFSSTQDYDLQYNLLMAASTLIVLPVIVLFLLFQKAFIGGITIGSLK